MLGRGCCLYGCALRRAKKYGRFLTTCKADLCFYGFLLLHIRGIGIPRNVRALLHGEKLTMFSF
ncbi:hypothetical protein ANAPC1_00105 [Anaplasma phagocytophilum]|uniref:Uncharacterized protein n=1 Tax=Anaplasma phagocytophilum TaxID=948 RepID=A0AA45ZH01_ANAPH|nr:hypothetical protein ANAPC1_00105 [Anaplasma phagocytophilum]